MTIVEFLYPVSKGSRSDQCLSALYFAQRYEAKSGGITIEELRALLKKGRIKNAFKLNLADILAKTAPNVDTAGKLGNKFLWALTKTGEAYVRKISGLPEADIEIENDTVSLQKLALSITDQHVSNYIFEAIKCLSINALRAAVVFIWAGAGSRIRDIVISKGLLAVNASVQKYDVNARNIKTVDDLEYLKESTLLLVAQDLSIFDKNEKSELENALNLRNKCGHPGKYQIGPKKASAFIEDVVGIVF
jgi:hypothetical protein